MTAQKLIHLARGKATCQIAPDAGGAIMALDLDGVAVMRRATGQGVLDAACFPLLPFANRIAHGQMTFGGAARAIAIDPIGAPHAIHGDGWRGVWQVEDTGPDHATLRLDQPAGNWPWPYCAWQCFTLGDDALVVEMTIQNRHETEDMPAGFGLHPYFPRTAQSAITTTASTMWFNDPQGLAQCAQETALFSGRPVGIEAFEGLDNFFAAPDPHVVITGAGVTVSIAASGVGFHLYAPGDHDYFCVEPVSHVPNSFGRGEFAAHDILAPMQSRSQTYRFGFQI